jgi:hypothetical protein
MLKHPSRIQTRPRLEAKGGDMAWQPGEIYKGWEAIHHALLDAMKLLPRQTLAFMANRASDAIIRDNAAHVLDWKENRHVLPDWGWWLSGSKERHRRSGEWACAVSRA